MSIRLRSAVMWLFEFFLWLLSYVIPKKERYILNSFPDYDDQIKHIAEELKSRNIEYYIAVSELSRAWENPEIVVKKFSARGIWTLLRSRYVVFTHGYYTSHFLRKEQITVNVWHGMPLKRIGYLDKGNKFTPKANYTLSTSPFFSSILADAFKISRNKVLEFGLPRNEILKQKLDATELQPQLKQLGIIFPDEMTLLLWLPTYRTSNIGDVRKDGDESVVLGLEDTSQLNELDEMLAENKMILLTKLHPMASDSFDASGYSNIFLISDGDLSDIDLTLYGLLAYVDCLITDYSSVYVDFKSTGRPIVLVGCDAEKYQVTRGFCFSELEQVFAEGFIGTIPKLKDALLKMSPNSTNKDSLCGSESFQSSKLLIDYLESK